MARTDPQVNMRMPAELKDMLQQAASANGRSLNAEIIQRLEQSFLAEDEASRAKVTAPLQMVELSADNKSFIRQLAFELSDVLNERVFLGSTLSEHRMVPSMPDQSKSHHVAPNPEGGWDVKKGGGEKSIKHTDTKQEAVDIARGISKDQQSEFVVHNKDGKISSKTASGAPSSKPKAKRQT